MIHSALPPKIYLHAAVGTGIIINYPSGIIYTNQTGGTACLQPEMEGFYVPVGNDIATPSLALISPENELCNYFNSKYSNDGAINGLDIDDANQVQNILSAFNLSDAIVIDRTKLNLSHEAWVYVSVFPEKSHGLFSNFGSKLTGVLTWCNSD